MKIQNSKFKVQSCGIFFLLLCCSAALLFFFSLQPSAFSAEKSEKWQGVDESVIEKVAKEHGREAKEPFINTDQGDLLLFVFLLAGTIGGFAAGYYWKELTGNKGQKVKE
ncbi:MAG: cobalt ABC transporter permease [Nitrospiraceae bacterium]|nr:MAG: cobalt ABC transporter permease [Nitrospiraceae bacterium]